jgi:hypothetical protein
MALLDDRLQISWPEPIDKVGCVRWKFSVVLMNANACGRMEFSVELMNANACGRKEGNEKERHSDHGSDGQEHNAIIIAAMEDGARRLGATLIVDPFANPLKVVFN